MKAVRRALLGVAIFQIISTLIGFVTLLAKPKWYEPALENTVFAGQFVLAAILLGIVVGGWQWVAAYAHLRVPQYLPLAHALAGTVMVGWIGGECLVMNAFAWAHALWGGMGVVQLLLVLVLLGVLKPYHAEEVPTSFR
jgi:hypothetical protein